MERTAFLASLMALALTASSACALSAPQVTFMPSDKVSAGGSFIMIADPGASRNDSMSVIWELNDPDVTELNAKGSLLNSGGRYVCYFSDSDSGSTCGPSPLRVVSSEPPRSFSVSAVTSSGRSNVTIAQLKVGSIAIQPSIFTNSSTISVVWSSALTSQLLYDVYYGNNLTKVKSGSVQYDVGRKGHLIDIPIAPGEYFVSLRIDKSGSDDFGGSVFRVTVPKTGGTQENGNVSESGISAAPAAIDVRLNKGQPYSKVFDMNNTLNRNVTNLSVVVPESYGNDFGIALSRGYIDINGTAYYTLTLKNTQSALDLTTNAEIMSGEDVVGKIPVSIKLGIVGETCQQCPASGGALSLSQQAWTGEYVAGKPAVFAFALTNTGKDTIPEPFNYTSTFSSSMLSVQLPSSLKASESFPANATLSPPSAGTQSGSITINSPKGSATITALVKFLSDPASSIDDLKSSMETFNTTLTSAQRASFSAVLEDINEDVSSAEDSNAAGRYSAANEALASAEAKLDALKKLAEAGVIIPGGNGLEPETGYGSPLDMTTIIMVVGIVLVVVLFFIFFKKRKSSRKEEDELEEELNEEFGPLPEEGK